MPRDQKGVNWSDNAMGEEKKDGNGESEKRQPNLRMENLGNGHRYRSNFPL